MGVYSGTEISEEGLVLCLDAANPRSYGGSGTTWYDLSGNSKNGTLVNGPTYSIDNKGNFTFDGVNDYATIPYDSNIMDFSLAQTICMWIRPFSGSNSARRNPYNQAYGGPGTLTYEINGTITYYFGTVGGNNWPYVGISSGFTISADELSFIAVTRNQTINQTKWYKNGNLYSTQSAGGFAATANGTNPILIGIGYTSGFLGKIYNCMVYNRALSAQEVEQNFKATRGRFGL